MKNKINFVELLKVGENISNRGWAREKKVADNLKIIFRKDFDEYSHKVKNSTKKINHYNIEIQQLNTRGKWKKKKCFHIMWDNLSCSWYLCD